MHAKLHGTKAGRRFLLLDACLTETRLVTDDHAVCGYRGSTPLDLVVIYWLREQDPTAAFDRTHERLPLQEHPGLGVLRTAFRVAVRMTTDLGKHGIAALPKFFHDAVIFYRSRLFLFLDPVEQGRFEALLRDLAPLSLRDATLAMAGGAVRDGAGASVPWKPGLQVMPLSPVLTDYFHAPRYQALCAEACEAWRCTVDADALAQAQAIFAASTATTGGPAAERPEQAGAS